MHITALLRLRFLTQLNSFHLPHRSLLPVSPLIYLGGSLCFPLLEAGLQVPEKTSFDSLTYLARLVTSRPCIRS